MRWAEAVMWMVIVISVSTCTVMVEAHAQDLDLRVGTMPQSHHWIKGDHNERHSGRFAELQVTPNDYFGILSYYNSIEEDSTAVYYGRTYPVTSVVDWGYQLGGVTGYNLPLTPLGALTLSAEFDVSKSLSVGSRLMVVPAVVVGYQFYVEF